MKITHAVGRCLVCIACGVVVDVLEACTGATTEAEHRWIDPALYACGECLCSATRATLTDPQVDTAVVAA